MFLWNSCFFDDPADVSNLISGSSAFSKTSLNIWRFMVHILLKPGLENFAHYFTSVWDECNCVVVWAFFGIGMKTDLFQSCGLCWVFQICSTFTASSFRIWNSSTGIPSPPLALFIVMLSTACWEPVWGTPPMAKVMKKEAWHTQRCDQASGNPLFPSIQPPNQSTLRGALPHNHFSQRRSKRAAPSQKKIPGCDKSVSTYELLWRFSSPPV